MDYNNPNNPNNPNNKCCRPNGEKCCHAPRCALHFAGFLFAVVALLHLYRFFYFFPVVIGTTVIPDTGSIVAFIIFAILSIWMFVAARKA